MLHKPGDRLYAPTGPECMRTLIISKQNNREPIEADSLELTALPTRAPREARYPQPSAAVLHEFGWVHCPLSSLNWRRIKGRVKEASSC